jgi:hypothetical protein
MDLIIDEAVGCVHFAACLAVWALERVLALERSAPVKDSGSPMPAVWHSRSAETGQPSELPRVNLTCDIGAHVDGRVIGPNNVILRQGLGLRGHGDLDKITDSLGGNLSRTKPRVDGCHFARSLILDAIVQQAGDVPVASKPVFVSRVSGFKVDRKPKVGGDGRRMGETRLLTSKTKPPSVSTLKAFPLVVTPNFAKAGFPRTQAVTATDVKVRRMIGSRRALFGEVRY